MKETKQQHQPQSRLLPFIIAWAFACLVASSLSYFLVFRMLSGTLEAYNLALFSLLATLQYFVIYRFLHVEIRRWIPLSVAGTVTGLIFLRAFPFGSTIDFIPNISAAIVYLLIWGMPAIFQWTALRKRFRYHALWLLAAVVIGPLGGLVILPESPGIFKQALSVFCCHTGSNELFLQSIAFVADFAIPSIVLGLIFYYVVTKGGESDPVDRAGQ